MPRFPVISTIIVALAVATMIGLGIWQLQRKGEKEALLALYAANATKPAMAFPEIGPVSDDALFRQSSATCMKVVEWRSQSGRDSTGKPGILYIAECQTGADGPGLLAAMGVADRPNLKPDWKGGIVSGMIVTEPDHYSFLERAFGVIPTPNPMLVSANAAPGLRTPAKPDPAGISNNHLSYALQWFFFAAAAAVIYVLALRKRQAKN